MAQVETSRDAKMQAREAMPEEEKPDQCLEHIFQMQRGMFDAVCDVMVDVVEGLQQLKREGDEHHRVLLMAMTRLERHLTMQSGERIWRLIHPLRRWYQGMYRDRETR